MLKRLRRLGDRVRRRAVAQTGVDLAEAERGDRRILLRLAAEHGPVFECLDAGRPTLCIVDLALGRRFLAENADALQPLTLDLTQLFPAGFMRQMAGDEHRRYRRALLEAVNGFDMAACEPELSDVVGRALEDYAARAGADAAVGHAFQTALGEATLGLLLRIFFGVLPGEAAYDRFTQAFRRLGPHGLVWNIGPPQVAAYEDLRAMCAEPATGRDSLRNSLADAGALDATMVGNLIYMVEMGRYDMRGLFRWIARYAAVEPDWSGRVATAGPEAGDLARAFVQEVLRLEQSERLMRNVRAPIDFEGGRVAEGGLARVCMWEAHKDGAAFPDPFRFDPERFLAGRPGRDAFSPFGLDGHQCPFSGVATNLGALFLRRLTEDYVVAARDDGPALRGAYHWEPAALFSVVLTPRSAGGG